MSVAGYADADVDSFIDVARNLGKLGFWREIDGPLFSIPGNDNDPFWRLVKRLFSEYDMYLRSEGKHDRIPVSTSDEEVKLMDKVL